MKTGLYFDIFADLIEQVGKRVTDVIMSYVPIATFWTMTSMRYIKVFSTCASWRKFYGISSISESNSTSKIFLWKWYFFNGSAFSQHDALFSFAISREYASLYLKRSLIASFFTRACSYFSFLIFGRIFHWSNSVSIALWFCNGSQIQMDPSYSFALSSGKRMLRSPALNGREKTIRYLSLQDGGFNIEGKKFSSIILDRAILLIGAEITIATAFSTLVNLFTEATSIAASSINPWTALIYMRSCCITRYHKFPMPLLFIERRLAPTSFLTKNYLQNLPPIVARWRVHSIVYVCVRENRIE